MNDTLVTSSVTTLKLIITGVVAAGTTMWGFTGWLILLWLVSMAMDYLSGTLAAIKNGEWNRKKAFDGLWHKGGMILVVLVAAALDFFLYLLIQTETFTLPIDYSTYATVVVLGWYTLTELLSTLENATRIAGRAPGWLSLLLKGAASAVDGAGNAMIKELKPGESAESKEENNGQ